MEKYQPSYYYENDFYKICRENKIIFCALKGREDCVGTCDYAKEDEIVISLP